MQVKEIFPSSLHAENYPLQHAAEGFRREPALIYPRLGGPARSISAPAVLPLPPSLPPWRGWEPLTHLPSSPSSSSPSSPHEEGRFEGLHCRPSSSGRQKRRCSARGSPAQRARPGSELSAPGTARPPQVRDAGMLGERMLGIPARIWVEGDVRISI